VNTQIDYLNQLEMDLLEAAQREREREVRAAAATPAGRRTGRLWMKVAGVAAAFLVVAGAIGFLAGGGAGEMAGVGGGGAEAPQRAVGRSVNDQAGPGSVPALPSPTTAPGGNHSVSLGGRDLGGFESSGNEQGPRDLSKIIRDGRIGVVVPDGAFARAENELTSIAGKHGGFVLSSSTSNERSGTFVLRIPAKHFDRALADVRKLGTRVKFQTVRGQDVTAEYIDYQARIRILQARKAVLLRLFDQADTIPETLQLQAQLDDVQLRIEQIQGQINFIDDQVAESTLRVTIEEKNAPHTEPAPNIVNPNLGSSWDLGIQGFLRIVGAVIVGLGYLIPLTILGTIVWLATWFVRRRRARV
jgi:Domain of unknown function (DUF4349)